MLESVAAFSIFERTGDNVRARGELLDPDSHLGASRDQRCACHAATATSKGRSSVRTLADRTLWPAERLCGTGRAVLSQNVLIR
ncbi:MAG: hypothetical protein JHC98_03030 [Thermoleophilaceae bacterium]|nr:hypothetical protein [Thermoleophilaceae bacterium]